MRNKLGTIACMIAGSYFVYCTQGANHSHGNPDGMVGDASAGSGCCTAPAPTFTKLASGAMASGTPAPAIAVGAYAEVVVYATTTGACSGQLFAQFRPDASTAYGFTGQALPVTYNNTSGGRLRVDGTDVILTSDCNINYAVAGVQ